MIPPHEFLARRSEADGERVREPSECAHYNPETDECVRVEAARAQIRIAKELSVIAQTLECETINICQRG